MFGGYAGKAIRWFVDRTDLVGTSTSYASLANKVAETRDLSAQVESLRSKVSELTQGDSRLDEVTGLKNKIAELEGQLALSDRHQTLAFWSGLDRVYDHVLKDRTLTCIVCGHEAKRDGFKIRVSECIFDGGKLERYECPTCECIFGAQKFLDQPDKMVDLDYKLLYSRYREGNTSDVEVAAFHSISPSIGESYVNWGCGLWNDTVTRLRNDGFDVWGYEPSAGLSSEHVVGTVEQLPKRVSGIFSNNVIEHFLDPVAQFKEFNAILPTGGRMAHSTACYDYLYDFTRFHTVFLTGKSPHVLAERTGFRVVDRASQGEHINVVFEKI